MNPAKDPVKNPARDSSINPARDSIKNPARDSSINPARDSPVNPTRGSVKNPARDSSVNPARDSSINPARDSIKNPARDSFINPARDSPVNPSRDSVKNPARDCAAAGLCQRRDASPGTSRWRRVAPDGSVRTGGDARTRGDAETDEETEGDTEAEAAAADTRDAPSGPPTERPPGPPAPEAPEVAGTAELDNEQLRCGRCRELLTQPKLLPCLHVFCLSCVVVEPAASDGPSVVAGGSVGGAAVRCPRCGERSAAPPGGASALPADPLSATRLLRLRVATRRPPCDLCCHGDEQGEGDAADDDVAHSYCEECCAFLCEFCTEAHRRQRPTAGHSLAALPPPGGGGPLPPSVRAPSRCPEHPAQELRYLCGRCALPACAQCCVAGAAHGAHACEAAPDAARRVATETRRRLGEARERVREMEATARELELLSDSVEERAEDTRQDIERFRVAYEQAVHAHYHALMRSLEQRRRRCRGALSARVAVLGVRVGELREAASFTEALLREGTAVDVMLTAPLASHRLAHLTHTSVPLDPPPPPPASASSPASSSSSSTSSSSTTSSSSSTSSAAGLAVDVEAEMSSMRLLASRDAGAVGGFPVCGALGPAPPHAHRCTAHGDGLRGARPARRAHFTVRLCGRDGEAATPVTPQVTILHREHTRCAVPVEVSRGKGATFDVSYTATETGSYYVSVTVHGRHIQGSPFSLRVSHTTTTTTSAPSSSRAHHGVYHCCSFCSSGGQRDARCACGGTMPGGFLGCGHGHPGHPGRQHWSCCGHASRSAPDCRPPPPPPAVPRPPLTQSPPRGGTLSATV